MTYAAGMTLADVDLPKVENGELSWAEDITAVTEGTAQYDAVFTPNDTVNYKTATGKITVTATAEVNPTPTPTITGTVRNSDGTAAANHRLTLKPLGLETITDENGNYAFDGVEPGSYDIVVETGDGKSVVTLVNVTGDNVRADITLPAANVGSAVETADRDNNSDIKVEDIVVGGLDKLAEAIVEALSEADKAKDIEVKMTVESKSAREDNAEQQAIRQQSQNKTEKLDYIDINIIKTVGTASENVTETTNLITIIIPFTTDGKTDITVYRCHEGVAEAMANGGAGERYEVGDGVVTIYTQKFSTYAIGYNDQSTTPTTNNGRKTGGSSSSTYTVRFDTNGGSEVASQRITRNNTVKEPTAPTKEGYEFVGWFTDKDLTDKYDFTAKVTKGFTLYAKWNDVKSDDKIDLAPEDQSGDMIEEAPEQYPLSDSIPFTDVKPTDWFYNAVKAAYLEGLISGVSDT